MNGEPIKGMSVLLSEKCPKTLKRGGGEKRNIRNDVGTILSGKYAARKGKTQAGRLRESDKIGRKKVRGTVHVRIEVRITVFIG